MTKFDNSKDVVLSKVVSDNPSSPVMRVNFEVNGQKYRAGLWPWTRKDGSPVTDKNGNALYKGKWEQDNYTQQQQQSGLADAQQQLEDKYTELTDDDIPF